MSSQLDQAIFDAVLSVASSDPAAADELRATLNLDRAPADADGWMGTRDAAAYLGMTVNALHKLTMDRVRSNIPFEQDVDGGKCWFKRSELDRWRQGGSGRAA